MKALLLTQPSCVLCDHAKAVLGRVARDFPLEIRILDLETEEGADLAVAAGMAFPPGLFLDGASFSHGRVSERLLRRELQRRTHQPARTPPSETSGSGASNDR